MAAGATVAAMSDILSSVSHPLPSTFVGPWTPARAWWFGIFCGDGNSYDKDGTYRVSAAGSEIGRAHV